MSLPSAKVDKVLLPVCFRRVFLPEGGLGGWEKLPRVADALCALLFPLKADPGTLGIGRQLPSHWLQACVSQPVATPTSPPPGQKLE